VRVGSTGWRIAEAERDNLLARFPPRYARVLADRCIHQQGVCERDGEPPVPEAWVVGIATTRRWQALIVAVGGNTTRPDGGTYHIPISLADGEDPERPPVVLQRGIYWLMPPDRHYRLTALLPAFFPAGLR
jgi:hypothetical protein